MVYKIGNHINMDHSTVKPQTSKHRNNNDHNWQNNLQTLGPKLN